MTGDDPAPRIMLAPTAPAGDRQQAIFAAFCTDATTGEPVPPERGVRYDDACPVRADGC